MRRGPLGLVAIAALAATFVVRAQVAAIPVGGTPGNDVEESTAAVTVDHRPLFRVRGISSYPPARRAAAIAARIAALAADATFDSSRLSIVESGQSFDIMSGQQRIMSVTAADAAEERVDGKALATVYTERMRVAIADYRRDRSPEALAGGAWRAAIATVVFVPGLWLVIRLTRRLNALLESRYRRRVRSVAIQSFQILQAEQIWSSVRTLLHAMRLVAMAIFGYFYLHFVLDSFVWTRPVAQRLLDYLTTPLATMGRAVLANLPDLIFLAILIGLARYALRLLRLFFDAIRRGGVALHGFDPEWALPSYRLARLGVIILTAVVAYPYIPGSGSEAFKGISIFLGVMFSIGSSSFLANIVAGYALIYRRAFKVGDRVMIDDVVGDVVQIRLQVTHLRSLKGEEVIVPNSLILNSKVVNYSSLAATQGLILHTAVRIGYQVAWRKVEMLLRLAAERTPGLLHEPKPFVLQQKLGEFAVTYELNVYCGDARSMANLYTAVHRNILDVFNEHEVQIMTPAYEGDPAEPKIAREVEPAVPTVAA